MKVKFYNKPESHIKVSHKGKTMNVFQNDRFWLLSHCKKFK